MTRDEEKLVGKIVGFLCRKYHIPAHDDETRQDMFHDGIIGLMDAKQKYDPDTQVPFRAYAGIRIHGAIVDAMRKKPVIRLPQEKQAQVKALLDARHLLAARDRTRRTTPWPGTWAGPWHRCGRHRRCWSMCSQRMKHLC